MSKIETREVYLQIATKMLREELFHPHDIEVPKIKVSIGFPKGRQIIGQCFHPSACDEQISQIYITPRIDDPIRTLDILCHELIHASFPDAKHGPVFRRAAKAVGLDGPMKATVAGEELTEYLQYVVDRLGEYPHSKIDVTQLPKQSTRLVKCECMECGYKARVTRTWIFNVGTPICPCNGNSMRAY